jgi:hypothetical protein
MWWWGVNGALFSFLFHSNISYSQSPPRRLHKFISASATAVSRTPSQILSITTLQQYEVLQKLKNTYPKPSQTIQNRQFWPPPHSTSALQTTTSLPSTRTTYTPTCLSSTWTFTPSLNPAKAPSSAPAAAAASPALALLRQHPPPPPPASAKALKHC